MTGSLRIDYQLWGLEGLGIRRHAGSLSEASAGELERTLLGSRLLDSRSQSIFHFCLQLKQCM